MRQALQNEPFIGKIVAAPAPALSGRWAALTSGAPVSYNGYRRPISAPAPVNAVAAIAHLLDGDVNLRHLKGSDPALVADFSSPAGVPQSIAYRMRSNQIYSTGNAPIDPFALTLFAARLLLNRSHYFSRDYLELLHAISDHRDQGYLDRLMLAAADSLMDETCGLLRSDAIGTSAEVVWFYTVRPDRDSVVELSATDGTPIGPLFSDFITANAYLRSGESTDYDIFKSTPVCGYWGAGQTW